MFYENETFTFNKFDEPLVPNTSSGRNSDFHSLCRRSGATWRATTVSQAGGFPTYPLKVSANGRYLVDQNGTPTLLVGDSPHSLFVNLSPASRCREFADIVWYLLRATDPPLYTELTDIILTPPDAGPCDSLHWYDLGIQYVPDFEVHLSGWFPAGIVGQEPSNSSIEFEAENLHTKQEKWSDDDLHSERRPDDVWVSGRALPTLVCFQRLLLLSVTCDRSRSSNLINAIFLEEELLGAPNLRRRTRRVFGAVRHRAGLTFQSVFIFSKRVLLSVPLELILNC